MKLLSKWGFTREGWGNGQRGEYWVLGQAVLLISFMLLPVYRPISIESPEGGYLVWAIASVLGLAALILIGKGLWDLGQQLTPLPYPKQEGQLVRSGVYGIVRHPLYSGVILSTLSWAVFEVSLSHLVGVGVLFAFLNAKANREEIWLMEKYPDYADYRQQVKKLIPWVY